MDPEELKKLLADAYEASPKKTQFLDKLGTLPGVLTSHQSHEFCLVFEWRDGTYRDEAEEE